MMNAKFWVWRKTQECKTFEMTGEDTYRIKISDGGIYNMFPEPTSTQVHTSGYLECSGMYFRTAWRYLDP